MLFVQLHKPTIQRPAKSRRPHYLVILSLSLDENPLRVILKSTQRKHNVSDEPTEKESKAPLSRLLVAQARKRQREPLLVTVLEKSGELWHHGRYNERPGLQAVNDLNLMLDFCGSSEDPKETHPMRGNGKRSKYIRVTCIKVSHDGKLVIWEPLRLVQEKMRIRIRRGH